MVRSLAQKATPDQARGILNSQPHISYGLIALMVKMNAINVEVFQRTLATFGQQNGATAAQPAAVQPIATAIPPHMNQPHSRGDTPHYPTPPPAAFPAARPPTQPAYGYTNGQPPQQQNPYAAPQPAQYPPPNLSDALAAIPEEQRVMIMHVVSMTPEQINQLPPAERANVMQLRASLGIP
ncbi:hypothetical protein EVG20_g3726 [Dentipellis fragilis]|uniref:Transcription termination and cleavage factor C-terminal domain-containing protein n=1 Tax=Dentipellis fragilis TaxID=205917 RepID=A0A4Y9Z1W5_9AGAM|nr:hypothetical protein EVG20_g3726 [Dentipellis fragilis]